MKKKRANIVTFHNAHNFGAVLQCYALKNAIETKFNCICKVCDIINNRIYNMYRPKIYDKNSSIKGNIAKVLQYPFLRKKYCKFNSFINTFLLNSDDKYCQFDDIYICGSDQIWNYKLSDFDKRYFLDFVENPKQKNAYSASFGFDEIPNEYIGEYKKLLSSFYKISVREWQGAHILKTLINADVSVTVDPTLLLDKNEWTSIGSIRKGKKEYILMYLMNVNDSIINFAKHLKDVTGLELVFISDEVIHRQKGIKYRSFIGPDEWITLFLNARYVVTNSFHGTAFSINFNKDFFVELLPPPSKVNSRLENIISLFQLEDRMIINGENSNINNSIDYVRVNKILDAERKKSLDYLKSIVGDVTNNE